MGKMPIKGSLWWAADGTKMLRSGWGRADGESEERPMSHNQHAGSVSAGAADEAQSPAAGGEAVALSDAPPERVGLLLAEARTRQGLGLAEVASRLGSDIDATELMALESGALEVDPALIEELAATYGVSPSALMPPRDALIIDLNEGYLRAGPDIALLTDGAGSDAVLTRYLEMIRELRSVAPGSVVTLRGADIAVLSRQLGEAPEVLESQLRRMMATGPRRPRAGVLVGLAAALLAVTGGVIALQATQDETPDTEPVTAVSEVTTTTAEVTTTIAEVAVLPPAPEAEIGEAEVLEREASEVQQRTNLEALPPAPSAEIGDAATLERGADEVPAAAPAPDPAPRANLESLPPAPSASVGDAAVVERNPDGSEGEQQTR